MATRSIGVLTIDLVAKIGGLEQGLDAAQRRLERLEKQQQKTRQSFDRTSKSSSDAADKFNKYGLSVKQTEAAMRGVPAQITDIFVSLQGGQAPLTVLLQQGGQLKDMFGGIRPAAAALSRALVGLINPFTAAGAGALVLAAAYYKGSKEADEFAKSIILTGNSSGTSVDQMMAYARAVDQVVGTQAKAAEAIAALAGAGVSGANLGSFAETAIKLERLAGIEVKDTVKQFEELGKRPVEASKKLNEQYNYLTASVYEQIRALQEQGKVQQAADLAQQTYNNAMLSRANQLSQRLGYIERAWRGVKDVAAEAWDEMLGIGRPETDIEKAQRLLQQINAQRSNQGAAALRNRPLAGDLPDPSAQAQEELRILSSRIGAEARLADWRSRSAKDEKAAIEAVESINKIREQAFTNEQKINKELKEYRKNLEALRKSNPASPLLDPKQIAQDEKNIRARFSKDTSRADSRAGLLLDIERIKAEADALVSIYQNAEKITEALRSAGLADERAYYAEKRRFLQENTRIQIEALEAENARLNKEKLNTKDGLDRDREVLKNQQEIAKLRADLSAQEVILNVQETSAITAKEVALKSMIQTQDEYLSSIQRSLMRERQGVGIGNQGRSFLSGIGQIEDRYSGQRRDLENSRALLELEGKFTEEARKQYEARLSIINDYEQKAIEAYRTHYDQLTQMQQQWQFGASEAIANYYNDAMNVAAQTEQLFTNAFKGMEDALVQFVTTGKLDFQSLASSIVADITRMIVKAQIMIPLMRALGLGEMMPGFVGPPSSAAPGGGGGFLGFFSSLFGGGLATGGPAFPGMIYEVNENGPEMLEMGGRQYLMMGNQAGRVIPNGGSPGGRAITVYVQAPNQTTSRASNMQFGRDVAAQLQVSMARNG